MSLFKWNGPFLRLAFVRGEEVATMMLLMAPFLAAAVLTQAQANRVFIWRSRQ